MALCEKKVNEGSLCKDRSGLHPGKKQTEENESYVTSESEDILEAERRFNELFQIAFQLGEDVNPAQLSKIQTGLSLLKSSGSLTFVGSSLLKQFIALFSDILSSPCRSLSEESSIEDFDRVIVFLIVADMILSIICMHELDQSLIDEKIVSSIIFNTKIILQQKIIRDGLDANKALQKQIHKVCVKGAAVIDGISNLGLRVRLPDGILLQLCSQGLPLVGCANQLSKSLQLGIINLVAVFVSENINLRSSIIGEVCACIFSVSKSTCKVNIDASTPISLHMCTYLLLQLTTAASRKNVPPQHENLEEAPDVTRDFAISLTSGLVNRWFRDVEADGTRTIIKDLIEDLILCVMLPECASAHLLLFAILFHITRQLDELMKLQILSIRKIPVQRAMVAIDILGIVCAKLHTEMEKWRNDSSIIPKKLDYIRANAHPTDEGEDDRCICKKGHKGQAMLDCDECHRWFHAKCVGFDEQSIDRGELDEISWICDDCRVIEAVKQQKEANRKKQQTLTVPSDENVDPNDSIEELQDADDVAIEETIILRQLILNYFTKASNHSESAFRTRQFLCSLWYEDDLNNNNRKQSDALLDTWESPGTKDESLKYLTADAMYRAWRTLLVQSELFTSFSGLFSRILSAIHHPQSAFRERAMKAVSTIVDADPSVMLNEQLKGAVEQCLHDTAISVRKVAVDVVGKCATHDSVLSLQYVPAIQSLVGDKGVSVRKAVIKMLADMIILNPECIHAADICWNFMQRLHDKYEEPTVKRMTTKGLIDFWLIPPQSQSEIVDMTDGNMPDGWSFRKVEQIGTNCRAETNDSDTFSANVTEILVSPEGKHFTSIEDARDYLRKQQEFKQQRVIECRIEAMACVVEKYKGCETQKLLNTFNELFLHFESIIGKCQCEQVVGKLVGVLIQRAMHLSNSLNRSVETDKVNDSSDANVRLSTSLPATLQILYFICNSNPARLVSHCNALIPLVQGEMKLLDSNVLHWVLQILNKAFPMVERPNYNTTQILCSQAIKVLYTKEAFVVRSGAELLSTLVLKCHAEPKFIMTPLRQFYFFLQKICQQRTIPQDKLQMASRAVYGLGALCCYYDFDKNAMDTALARVVQDELSPGRVLPNVLSVYSSILQSSTSPSVLIKLFKGLRYLVRRSARILLSTKEWFIQALRETSDDDQTLQLKATVIQTIAEILQDYEHLIPEQMHIGTSQVIGSIVVDLGTITGVVQDLVEAIKPLATHNSASIRVEVCETFCIILRQGHVHPNKCLAILISMLVDPEIAIRSTVFDELNHIAETQAQYLSHCAIEGIIQAFELSSSCKTEASKFVYSDIRFPESGYFNSFFSSIIREKCKSTKKLLEALVRSLFQCFDCISTKSLEKLWYLIQVLCSLPIESKDEVMVVLLPIYRRLCMVESSFLERVGDLVDQVEETPQKKKKRRESERITNTSITSILEALPRKKFEEISALSDQAIPQLALLHLKSYFQQKYKIKDAQIEAFEVKGTLTTEKLFPFSVVYIPLPPIINDSSPAGIAERYHILMALIQDNERESFFLHAIDTESLNTPSKPSVTPCKKRLRNSVEKSHSSKRQRSKKSQMTSKHVKSFEDEEYEEYGEYEEELHLKKFGSNRKIDGTPNTGRRNPARAGRMKGNFQEIAEFIHFDE